MSEESIFAPIEIEESVKKVKEKKEALGELQRLCDLYKSQELKIKETEEQLKTLKSNLEVTSRKYIPELFSEYGLAKIELATGQQVTIEDQLKVSLSGVQTPRAIQEMIDLQFEEDCKFLKLDRPLMQYEGDLILNTTKKVSTEHVMSLFTQSLSIEGTKEELERTKDFLNENQIPFTFKVSIHPQTLKKYCKDRRGQGLPVPEQINVFIYKETKIK